MDVRKEIENRSAEIYKSVCRFACSFGVPADQIDDLFQDTVIKLLMSNAASKVEPKKLVPYAITVARNIRLTEVRSPRYRRSLPIFEAEALLIPAVVESSEDRAIEIEKREILHAYIGKQAPKRQAALYEILHERDTPEPPSVRIKRCRYSNIIKADLARRAA